MKTRFLGAAFLALVLAATTAGPASAATKKAPIPDQFSYSGVTGDFVSQGRSASFVEGTSGGVATTITSFGTRADLTVRIDDNQGHWWYVRIAAPKGHNLRAGKYQLATGAPFQAYNEAGLSVTGEHRGCNESYGSFTVKTIEFDRTGMTKLDMTFEQRCEATTAPAMRGSVRMGLKG